VNKKERAVFKDPVTDSGKVSKKGKLSLVRGEDGKLKTVVGESVKDDLLVEVFRNGKLLIDQKFADIRKRAEV